MAVADQYLSSEQLGRIRDEHKALMEGIINRILARMDAVIEAMPVPDLKEQLVRLRSELAETSNDALKLFDAMPIPTMIDQT